MPAETIAPDWPAPARVRALVTTRDFGDMKGAAPRARLRARLPADPVWLRQVHGIGVVDAARAPEMPEADASFARAATAVAESRPGHWRLDLYAVARQRLASLGITRVTGGGYCTASDPARFYSYRRDKASERMAAVIWLA